MTKIKFSKAAKTQARNIFVHYYEIDTYLAFQFQSELSSCIDSFYKIPEAYPIYYNHHRKKLMKKFPYGIFYKIIGETILITGILHLSSDKLKAKLN